MKTVIAVLFLSTSVWGGEKSFDCGVMTGLNAAANSLSIVTAGYGDARYWEHHWEIRRDQGVTFAASLEKTSSQVQPDLAVSLGELVKDLNDVNHAIGGPAPYWISKISEQDQTYGAVAKKMDELTATACQ